jgi:hypothetical protein
VTEAEAGELAVSLAKKVASRWGHRDWGEFVAAAWDGVRECGGDARAPVAAYCRIADQLRRERGRGGRRRTSEGLVHLGGLSPRDLRAVAPVVADPDPHDTLLAAWCDSYPSRRHLPFRLRLVAYLYAVEGWTLREVGEVVGVKESRASRMFAEFRAGVCGGQDCGGESRGAGDGPEADRETGRGGEGRGGGAAGGGTGGGLQPGGSETQRGATVLVARREGGGGDAGGVAGVGGAGPAEREGEDGRGQAVLRLRTGAAGAGDPAEAGEPGDGGPSPGPVPADGAPARPPGRRSVAAVSGAVVSPAAASAKAAVLRAAMFDSVGSGDVAEVMAAILAKAKAGDAKAAALFFSLVGGGR